MSIDRDELRALVREVVRDAVNGLAAPGVQPTGPSPAQGRAHSETVRLSTDADLDGFVRKLLRLFENPKNRAALKTGRLRFRLAAATPAAPGAGVHRVDSGAVTERHIADLNGGTLVLGRRAVLTPLAREKARALGITITKEPK